MATRKFRTQNKRRMFCRLAACFVVTNEYEKQSATTRLNSCPHVERLKSTRQSSVTKINASTIYGDFFFFLFVTLQESTGKMDKRNSRSKNKAYTRTA